MGFPILKHRMRFHAQHEQKDCGPTCLKMIAGFYGKNYSRQFLREQCYITREGISLAGLEAAAKTIGFKTQAVKVPTREIQKAPMPLILFWQERHFVVLHKVKNDKYWVVDPAFGHITYSFQDFEKSASYDGNNAVLFLLEPTDAFQQKVEGTVTKKPFLTLLKPISSYKTPMTLVVLTLLVANGLGLVFPFLTQYLVDYGLNLRDTHLVIALLAAQFFLFIGREWLSFCQSWLVLHIGTRVNISTKLEFLLKIANLPLAFFGQKMIGDLLQRLQDHHRIEQFLTKHALDFLFSFSTLIVFGLVLLNYNATIFLIFCIGSGLSLAWALGFMRRRAVLDFKRFSELAHAQSNTIQFISGIQEIKLNGCESEKLAEWQAIQRKIYDTKLKSLMLTKYKDVGCAVFNELKNLLITFIAALAVIQGDMTLGVMLAISFIIGQLNVPILQLLSFVEFFQDTQIGLERLGEIQLLKDEDAAVSSNHAALPKNKSLELKDVSFHYLGPHSQWVLKNINAVIPAGKTTAIVGKSGSGKTTLLKLLLLFFHPTKGAIAIDGVDLRQSKKADWRLRCGVVLQDGFIFSDTVANNIALSGDAIDLQRVQHVADAAQIRHDIEQLPKGFFTNIGPDGYGLSAGQKQRILIARALYRDPEFLFLDEATSALDTENERLISENLKRLLVGKTTVVIAHRLSTVRHADQILVMESGEIVERGTHQSLVAQKGPYFQLVKNQLDLEK